MIGCGYPLLRRALLLGIIPVIACGGSDAERLGDVGSLIRDEYSELRYTPSISVLHEFEINFSTPGGAELVDLVSAEGVQQADGLLVLPRSVDPIVSIREPPPGFNRVTVEMNTSRAGMIEVFWAGEREDFAAERSRSIPVKASSGFEEYVFDLSAELRSREGSYRLRVDPLDQAAPFVLKRIVLSRALFHFAEGANGRPVARKVKLGREVREALVVSNGAVVTKSVTIPAEAELSFAIGKAYHNAADAYFRLSFRDASGGVTRLLEEALPAGGAEEWSDRVLSLRSLAGRRGQLEASVRVDDHSSRESAVAFWANPSISSGSRGSGVRPNVLLVSLDTLGSQHLSMYGTEGVGDRFISRLAKTGAVFENSFAASSVTHVSHASLLTGTSPLEASPFWLGGGSLQDVTLAEMLRRAGYATAAFTGGVLVIESLGFDRGFERFYQRDTLIDSPLARTDIEQVLGLAESWIAGASPPWFAFVHSYEVHSPYYLRMEGEEKARLEPEQVVGVTHMKGRNPMSASATARYLKRLDGDGIEITREDEAVGERDIEELYEAYRSEIRFVDRTLEPFFERLEEQGLLADTVIVLTSDHGEAFFEHGLLEHGLLYDENLRVPLLLVAPGRVPPGVRVAAPVTAVDVVPTILDLVGVRAQKDLEGRSLVDAMRGRELAPVPSYAFVPGNGLVMADGTGKKLIWRLALLNENYGRDELFDRSVDPSEQENLLAANGADQGQAELTGAAARLLQRIPGAHLSLEELAGETCRVELAGADVNRDRVYARDIGLREPMRQRGDVWGGLALLGRNPRLIVMSLQLESQLRLKLQCEDGRQAEFAIELGDLQPAPGTIQSVRSAGTITAWSVNGKQSDGPSRGLSDQEEENLRSLGYVQ